MPYRFMNESREEDSIEEFASSLTELEQDSSRIIIRGQLKDDVATDE